jgi:hypothetical protein
MDLGAQGLRHLDGGSADSLSSVWHTSRQNHPAIVQHLRNFCPVSMMVRDDSSSCPFLSFVTQRWETVLFIVQSRKEIRLVVFIYREK